MFNPSTPIPGLGLLQRSQQDQEQQGSAKAQQSPATTSSLTPGVGGQVEPANRKITPMAEMLSATTIGTAPSTSTDDRSKPEQSSTTVSPLVAEPQAQDSVRQAPQLQAPQLQAPQLQAPQLQAPQLQAPQLQAPQLQAPQLQALQLQAPQLQAPQIQAPQPQAPQPQEDTEMSQHPADEHPEWEVDSSPYESSSSSDSDSDSDSDDDDDEDDDAPLLNPAEAARILMAEDNDSDDEGRGKGSQQVATTHEVPEEIVPIPDITVTPDMRVEYLGQVENIVDNVILIEGSTGGEYQVLEAGSALCLADNRVIGVVADTLGRVDNPRYTVRFSTPSTVAELGLQKSTPIFYITQHSTFVFTQPLKKMKGSDASNLHDEEVSENEVEFSDDEQEKEFKRKQKLGKKARAGGSFRGRGGFSNGGNLGRGANSPRPGPPQPPAPAVSNPYPHPGTYTMWSVDSLDY